MKRKIYDQLLQWKNEKNGTTALMIEGARRIGKSYIAEKFAENEYDSAEKIAQTANSYAKVGSIFNPIEGGYEFTVSKFDGRETLWSHNLKEEKDMEIEFSFSLSNGKAKIVHIDADDNQQTQGNPVIYTLYKVGKADAQIVT